MKDPLLDALMRLFSDCLSQRRAQKDEDGTSNSSFGGLPYLEENTYFIRPAHLQSRRIFNPEELLKLSRRSYQFLEKLIQLDLIGEHSLELIINQLLFSDSSFVELDETKWTVQQTLADGLSQDQRAFLNLVLYDQEDNVLQH